MKTIIKILIALCVSHTAFAQSEITDPKSNIISLEIKAGLNYTQLNGKDMNYIFADDKTTFKPGFHAGIAVHTRMGKNFGLVHELLFSQRNFGVNMEDDANGVYSSRLNAYYLDLMPVNLGYHLNDLKIYVGPYVSALITANIKRKDENGKILNDKSIFGQPDNDESDTKYLQKFDFGVNAGAEYLFDKHFNLGIRYIHGFTDSFQYASSYDAGDSRSRINIHNHGVMISLGYIF